MKTIDQVKQELARGGQSVSEWAMNHGYPAYLVQNVLSGRSRALRGKSHEIAVLLQIKDGYIRQECKKMEDM